MLLSFVCWGQRANDCTNAVVVCGNSVIESNASGFGVQELDNTSNPCFFEEVNSLWLQLNIAESGLLAFTLTPDSPDIVVDYDFYVFGPSDSCGNFNDPVRCSTTNPVNAGLASNLTGLRDSETDDSEGPGPNGNSFVSSLPVFAGETYYLLIDRPVGEGGFSLDWTGTSSFFELPPLGEPDDIDLCLANSATTVDLTQNQNQITTDPSLDIAYFISRANAFDGANPITSLTDFEIGAANTPIFVKVTGVNECFEILEFNIVADDFINTSGLTYTACDQDGDLEESFDLDTITTDVATLVNNPGDYDISFHPDPTAAEDNTGSLTGPSLLAMDRSIFTRITSLTDASCFVVIPIKLRVVTSPIPAALELIQCDVDPSNSIDGITGFNLEQLFESIEGIENFEIFFYETIADRDANTPIANTIGYTNTTPFTEDIYYRLLDRQVGCENLGVLTLQIQPTTLSLNSQSPFFACDDNPVAPGLEGTFDLDIIRQINYLNLDVNFYASLDDVTLEQNPLSGNYTTTSTTIYVRIENAGQCQGVEEIELLVNPAPDFVLDEELLLCTDGDPLTLTAPIGFDTYTWYRLDGATEEAIGNTTSITINTTGTYALEAGFSYTSTSGTIVCSNREQFVVIPSNRATILDILIEDVSENNTVQISVMGDGLYEYSLDGENYQDASLFENVASGFLTVFVRDKNGCGITEEDIAVIGFPKFFTPNGDGINDFWQILGVNDLFQPNTFINIHDRYGKLLAQILPGNPGWNGTFNNQELPASDYWFRVNLEDGRQFNGHFALKR